MFYRYFWELEMVERFNPIFSNIKIETNKDGYKEATFATEYDLDDFLYSESNYNVNKFLQSHEYMFGYMKKNDTIEFKCAQEVLRFALLADKLSFYELKNENTKAIYIDYLDELGVTCLCIRVPKDGAYSLYLKANNNSFFSLANDCNNDTKTDLFTAPITKERETADNIFDLLFTAHISNIKTVSRNKKEERLCTDLISAIWWFALDKMRDGRVGVCEECGSPFITKGERGHKRKFCSVNCRQRHYKKKTTPPAKGVNDK